MCGWERESYPDYKSYIHSRTGMSNNYNYNQLYIEEGNTQ